jgi:hypothetical protein
MAGSVGAAGLSPSLRLQPYTLKALAIMSSVNLIWGFNLGVMAGAILFIKDTFGLDHYQREYVLGAANICSGFFALFLRCTHYPTPLLRMPPYRTYHAIALLSVRGVVQQRVVVLRCQLPRSLRTLPLSNHKQVRVSYPFESDHCR